MKAIACFANEEIYHATGAMSYASAHSQRRLAGLTRRAW
jgi:hypothetical protein